MRDGHEEEVLVDLQLQKMQHGELISGPEVGQDEVGGLKGSKAWRGKPC